jgi:hypothetical protein
MDEKKAKFLVFEKELKAIQSRDNIKNVVASIDFAREIVSQLSFDAIFDANNFLVVSDSMLLLALLERLDGHEINFKNVTFLCHTKEVEEYVRENFGITTWFVSYENLKNDFFAMNTNNENDYNFNGMKFSCIIGNPPYNGVPKKDVPKEIVCDLASGYNVYYAFILKSISLLQDGGELIFVTPREWLASKAAISLRKKILSECFLADVEWVENPWGQDASTGIVSIFKIQKNGKIGCNDTLCVVNDAIAQTKSQIDVQIIKKVTSFLQKYGAVEFFRGGKNDCDCEERDYVETYVRGKNDVIISRGHVNGNQKTEDAISRKVKKFLLYTEFTYAHTSTFLSKKACVDPMPINDNMIIVPTNTPEKHATLLESSVARFIHSMFFSNAHLANSLQGFLPDVTSLLSDNPNDNEIFDVFGLSDEEREYVKSVI